MDLVEAIELDADEDENSFVLSNGIPFATRFTAFPHTAEELGQTGRYPMNTTAIWSTVV